MYYVVNVVSFPYFLIILYIAVFVGKMLCIIMQVVDDDDDDDCRFVKRITQDASTALPVPVRCEEVSFQR